jgi:hypothetical protein
MRSLSESRGFVWGWMRLLVGLLQMGLSAGAFISLIVVGLAPISLWFVIGATAATSVSLIVYRGRRQTLSNLLPLLRRRERE